MTKITKKEIENLLKQRFCNDKRTTLSQIPLPECLKDIYKAAQRIKQAIEKSEKIAIVGDYDADGVISSVIMSEFFDDLGVNYTLKIPNRFKDGYGLNENIVKELDANLIITVDNGISAIEAGELCEQKGIDLIITDHHIPLDTLPKAYAIVNPKQKDCDFPFTEICGAQVAWYLVGAIKEICKVKYDMGKFLDLLAIAIMADMMELKDMNRTIAKSGLERINTKPRPAFKAICQTFRKAQISSDDISFLIAPLINCTGRMDDATLSYKFLKSQNIEEAIFHLEKIVHLNNERKEEEKKIFDYSIKCVEEKDDIIMAWGEKWHEGVVGIVASRLARHFNKPALVFSVDENTAKGSARSSGNIDILSLIAKQENLLKGYGGHKGAAGVVIKPSNLEKLKISLINDSRELDKSLWEDLSDIMGEISLDDVDLELVKIISKYEPYGNQNPKPCFIAKNLFVKDIRHIGKNNNHLKILFENNKGSLESLFFNYDKNIKKYDTLDISFNLSKNTFKGLTTPQILIKKILKIS